MKSCPKCSRTYPDDHQKFCTFDGGLLTAANAAFDPNATIASTRGLDDLSRNNADDMTRDLASTIASRSMSTGGVSKPTGPTGSETIFERAPASQPPPPTAPPPRVHATPSAPKSPTPVTTAPKSKLPLILGIGLVLLVLGVGAAAAVFMFVIKPKMDEEAQRPVVVQTNDNKTAQVNENVNTAPEKKPVDEYVAPPNSLQFANSNTKLDGKLADHYFDFSFYYPNTWHSDPKAGVPGASNFVKVERRLPPDFTQENFAVGWYTSRGTFEADEATFPQLVEILGANLARGFPEYRKISEGPTKVNSLDAYEFRFSSVSKGTEKGDLELWGRVIFLPTGVSGDTTGATLILLATSLAPEISGPEDVGSSGEMPVILDSFRFAKKP